MLLQNKQAARRRTACCIRTTTTVSRSARCRTSAGSGWGTQRASAFKGEWKTVSDRAWRGTATPSIISNELLGGATPERIAAGIASVEPADVHVIFSARDFARQLVSDWQEHIKHKHEVTLEKFVDDLIELGLEAPKPFGELFWGMHDASYVLRRWAVAVPTENIHVVTLPQPGAPKDTLWRRFCEATGLDHARFDSVTERVNPSMGVAETELVRRMNASVQGMPPRTTTHWSGSSSPSTSSAASRPS